MTAEQLLAAGDDQNQAPSAAAYITGWKEGTGIQLMFEAQDLRTAGGQAVDEYAARLQALGRCLMAIEVSGLAANLRAEIEDEVIEPDATARSVLRDAATKACKSYIEEELNQ